MSFEFQDFETLVEIPGEGQVRLVLSDDLDAAYAVTGDDGAHR